MSTYATAAFDSAIVKAIRSGEITTSQARLVRAITEVTQADIHDAIKAAKVLDITPHQVRTNYRAAGITFDLVRAALAS